jgi:hypothetical protein
VIPEGHELLGRVVADSRDRPAWLAHRPGRIGGSDAAGFSKLESVPSYVKAKLQGSAFQGNAFTRHGNEREQRILRQFHIEQNTLMFRSVDNERHVATPDGVIVAGYDGHLVIAEVKTTTKPFTKVPLGYLRQCLWNMHVIGATECLFAYEPHQRFVATDAEPESMVVRLDDHRDELQKLVTIADAVLEGLDAAAEFRRNIA